MAQKIKILQPLLGLPDFCQHSWAYGGVCLSVPRNPEAPGRSLWDDSPLGRGQGRTYGPQLQRTNVRVYLADGAHTHLPNK